MSLGLTLGLAGQPMLAGMAAATLGAIAFAAPSQAATLTAWRFDPSSGQLELTVPEGTTPQYFLLAEPARIVVDLPNTDLGAVSEWQQYSGTVRQIRVSQFQPGLTRIVMELSPTAVLGDRQVELRQVEGGSQTRSRWIVRPLMAGDPAAEIAPETAPAAPASGAIATLPPSANTSPNPSAEPPARLMVPPLDESAAVSSGNPPVALPPLEPGAVEIPVETPQGAIAPAAPPAAETAVLPAESPSESPDELPDTLPPFATEGDRDVTVNIPPLNGDSPRSSRPENGSTERPTNRPTERPDTPTVRRTEPTEAIAPPPSGSRSASDPSMDVIAFGQPLPGSSSGASSGSSSSRADTVTVASTSRVLIPSGTVLALRYSGSASLQLEAGLPWQEALVLEQTLRDRNGTVIAPAGSVVLGQFEANGRGSKFIARALRLSSQTLLLSAESDNLSGDFRGDRRAAPAATIQPNQIIEVRITRDVPTVF